MCLADRGVPGIHDGMPVQEALAAQYRPYYYSTLTTTVDRSVATQVRVFGDRGWFSDGAVVGLQHFDDPLYQAVVDDVFIPAVRSYGVERIVTQPAPRGGADGATSYSARFRAEGVTHVMFLGEAGAYPLFFMRGAQSQLYSPQYGLSTDNQLITLQAGAPPEQLANAIAMGWVPALDVDTPQDPGPVSAENTLCLDIQRQAGQDMSNRGSQLTALGYCSGLFFLQQALALAPSVTVEGLGQGAAALGSGFASPAVYGTTYTAARHDGVSAYRDLAFANGVFAYTSDPRPMP